MYYSVKSSRVLAVDMSFNQVMWCNLSNDSVWCGHNVERKVWSHMVCHLSARLWRSVVPYPFRILVVSSTGSLCEANDSGADVCWL